MAFYVLEQAQGGEISVQLSVFAPSGIPISEPFSVKVSKVDANKFGELALELVELGIGSIEVCLEALRKFNGDKEQAVEHILGQY